MMGGYGPGYDYGYGMMGGGWFGWVLMLGFWLLLLVGLVVLIVWAVRATTGGHGHAAGPETRAEDEALAIARRRLATGEITPEEFETLRKILSP